MERLLYRLLNIVEPIRMNSNQVTSDDLTKCEAILSIIQRLNDSNTKKKNEFVLTDKVMDELFEMKIISPYDLAKYYLHTVGGNDHMRFDDIEIKPNKRLERLQSIYSYTFKRK